MPLLATARLAKERMTVDLMIRYLRFVDILYCPFDIALNLRLYLRFREASNVPKMERSQMYLYLSKRETRHIREWRWMSYPNRGYNFKLF